MSDPTVRTNTGVPRSELRAAFGAYPRLIKAFENLLEDVQNTLPTQIIDQSADANATLQQRSFTPMPMVIPPAVDAVGAVLAAQIFGA